MSAIALESSFLTQALRSYILIVVFVIVFAFRTVPGWFLFVIQVVFRSHLRFPYLLLLMIRVCWGLHIY